VCSLSVALRHERNSDGFLIFDRLGSDRSAILQRRAAGAYGPPCASASQRPASARDSHDVHPADVNGDSDGGGV
jgi:hypothetical protein